MEVSSPGVSEFGKLLWILNNLTLYEAIDININI